MRLIKFIYAPGQENETAAGVTDDLESSNDESEDEDEMEFEDEEDEEEFNE